ALRPRLIKVLESLRLPTSVELDADAVYAAMTHDKKGEGNSVTVTTVSRPGEFEMKKVQFKELYPMIQMIGR
ncbi:MAG: hypothetical protein IJ639_12815, partial [Ruminococcus sp.]|nr:hypothetical protein [Ruminococcus sp.]